MSSKSRAEYGVSQEAFVIAWQSSSTVDEVFEKLKVYSQSLGHDAMPRPVILARASSYRQSGIALKKMPRLDNRTLDVEGMNSLIKRIDGGEPVQMPSGEPAAAPPSREHDAAAGAKRMMDELGKGRKTRTK